MVMTRAIKTNEPLDCLADCLLMPLWTSEWKVDYLLMPLWTSDWIVTTRNAAVVLFGATALHPPHLYLQTSQAGHGYR